MRYRDMKWAACGVAVLGAFGLTEAAASDWAARDTLPVHYSGLLNDHTPSAAVVKGGPYEMRGKWSLEVDERHGACSRDGRQSMTAASTDQMAGRLSAMSFQVWPSSFDP